MMATKAGTVEAYLAELPAERRASIAAVRDVVNRNLPAGFRESMQYGLIGWAVPLERFAKTYNRQPLAVAALGARKGYLSLHLVGLYGDEKLDRWFRDEFARSGKKLDMGMGCLRFKRADDLPLELIGRTIAKVSAEDLIARHEAVHNKAAVAERSKARAAAKAKPVEAAKPAKVKPAKAKPPKPAKPAKSQPKAKPAKTR